MSNLQQLDLALIDRNVEDNHISQRLIDGYINATSLCEASGKKLGHYLENVSTKLFLNELKDDIGIPITELVKIVRGGNPQFQGTWVHPQVAINLAQWASPKFAVLVSKWVFEWMSGSVPNGNRLPYHLQRYLINRTQIPTTHFSIFNEIVYNLIAPLEDKGYELPDKLVPDISQGRMFANWVRKEKGLEPNDFPTYTHTYPDGRSIPGVKLYPNFLLGDFRDHFNTIWLKERASDYFKERDQNAIPYLQEMIKSLPSPQKESAFLEKSKVDENLSDFNKSLKKAIEFNPKE